MRGKYGNGLALLALCGTLLMVLSIVRRVSRKAVEAPNTTTETATFGGGCFWGMEQAFEGLDGVVDVVSGYSGGTGERPVYDDYRQKGHTEVIRVTYDPERIEYAGLLDVFWRQVGTKCQARAVGNARKTVVFYHNDKQKELAEDSKEALDKSGLYEDPVVTEIVAASVFHKAEEYHQDYYKSEKQ